MPIWSIVVIWVIDYYLSQFEDPGTHKINVTEPLPPWMSHLKQIEKCIMVFLL